LRYPADNKDKSVETSEEQRERELQELELAKELAEDDDDDY
jgi:26S proteasome regulatory subunit N3